MLRNNAVVVDSVTVLDACHWISVVVYNHAVFREVRHRTSRRRLLVDHDSFDDDDDVPLARLIDELRDHDIADPLSARDYANMDADVPVNDSMALGWEDRLFRQQKRS